MTGLDNSPPPSSVESSPREYDFEKKKGKIRGLWKNLGETGLRKNVNKRGITSLAEANRNDSMVNLRLFLENRSANITLDRTPSKSSILSRADFISPRKHAVRSMEMESSELNAVEVLKEKIPEHGMARAISEAEDPCAILYGPSESEQEDRFGDFASAWTISTYPRIPDFGRSGDPICDRFFSQLYQRYSLIALADGCNWGIKPREAAILACNEIISYLSLRILGCKHTADIGCILLKGLMRAHDKILAKEESHDAGTTTVLAGVIVELDQPINSKGWAFVCVSVGDCKAFRYSVTKGTFSEITVGNRMNLTDARDCGGRLGPVDASLNPDLRNLMSYYTLLDEGDIVVAVSDGVHDNLDPQLRGLAPSIFGIHASSWEEAEKRHPQKTRDVKSTYLLDLLQGTVQSRNAPVTPHLITTSLINLSRETTKAAREFMETSLGARQPDDYATYPGKMDHTSCVAVSAQEIPRHPFERIEQALCHPESNDHLTKFVPEYDLEQPPVRGVSEEWTSQRLLERDLDFLRRFYRTRQSEISPGPETVLQVLSLLQVYSENEEPPIFSKYLEDTLIAFCHEYLDSVAVEVEKRVGPFFQRFQETEWMKAGCFSLASPSGKSRKKKDKKSRNLMTYSV